MAIVDEPILAIFDHDGVLVDTLELHVESWLELGRREGLAITSEFVRETFGRTNGDILRMLQDGSASDEVVRRQADAKEQCYRELARGRLGLMAGVRETLDALTEAGARLAIGSSGPRANLDLTVSVCGLDGRFATIASSEDVSRGKPDPEVFLVAARRAGVAPSRCVVFEDAPFGIEAAKSAGMLAVGLGTTHAIDHLKAHGADEVVPNLIDYDLAGLLSRFAT